MRKRFFIILLCSALLFPSAVWADVLNYEATINTYKQDSKLPFSFILDNGAGKTVQAVAKQDVLYVTEKSVVIRSKPGKKGKKLRTVLLGTKLQRVAVCDNGWSKVTFKKKGERKVIGYVLTSVLSDESQMEKFTDTVKVAKDCDILDYPGRKDGQAVGEVLEEDEVTRTGTINAIWSRIIYQDEAGKDQVGYIPTNVLEGQENVKEVAKVQTTTSEKPVAGVLSKSEGKGVFAEALDGVTATTGDSSGVTGVQIGTPISVSSEAVLRPLGNFRITHYCPCSICCGPWANGITSTGVTATTNKTIAVDPTQIPYGSKVVINGQIYVAEDCGGAIKTNCIDIYVASHDEGESKGVFYTDVYLLEG